MLDVDSILLNQGLPDIPFGATPNEIRVVLGEEDSLESLDDDGDFVLAYQSIALEFTFWGEYGDRLGYISTDRPDAMLLGFLPFGKNSATVKDFIANKLGATVTEEDGCLHEDGHRQTWLHVEACNVTFWFRDDSLYSVAWTCNWTGDLPEWVDDSEA